MDMVLFEFWDTVKIKEFDNIKISIYNNNNNNNGLFIKKQGKKLSQ